MNVQILPIAEEHIEGFYACLDSVARERAYLAMTRAPPLSSVQTFVRSNIASGVPQFVALVDDEVVGWCDILPGRHDGFTHVGELGMGVRKDLRGQGIGTGLLDATLAQARTCGLERVELEVFSLNKLAIRLYEKRGFVVEGVKKGARKLDGVYDDVICMALRL